MKIYAQTNGHQFQFDYDLENGKAVLKDNGTPIQYELLPLGQHRYSLIVNNRSYLVQINSHNDTIHIQVAGEVYDVLVEDERTRQLRQLLSRSAGLKKESKIKSQIPGLVVRVNVEVGQEVKNGQSLIILEAMKMENEIRAPGDGKIKKVHVKEGQAVEKDQLLIELE